MLLSTAVGLLLAILVVVAQVFAIGPVVQMSSGKFVMALLFCLVLAALGPALYIIEAELERRDMRAQGHDDWDGLL